MTNNKQNSDELGVSSAQLDKVKTMKINRSLRLLACILSVIILSGCGSVKINLIQDYSEPLREFTIEGDGWERILVIPINGMISGVKEKGMMSSSPSLIQEVVSHLKKAKKDKRIKAVILKVNSPGGTVTGSDLLYHEIMKFKEETGVPVIACMMGMATSGGYYVSLPADYIVAHPTTVTGSVGVIFMRPKFNDLMGKIGVGVEISKSGYNKDMGSPFRPTTEEEQELFQKLIDDMAVIFKEKVVKHRKLSDKNLKDVLSAKVYLAKDALNSGLIDEVGFIDDAVLQARKAARLRESHRLVMYRRSEYADDNVYNDTTAHGAGKTPTVDLGVFSTMTDVKTGFYYLWPAVAQ